MSELSEIFMGNKQTSLTDVNKKSQATDNDVEETVGQKMKKLAEAWKDAYKTSGSKEIGMEKVLSIEKVIVYGEDEIEIVWKVDDPFRNG